MFGETAPIRRRQTEQLHGWEGRCKRSLPGPGQPAATYEAEAQTPPGAPKEKNTLPISTLAADYKSTRAAVSTKQACRPVPRKGRRLCEGVSRNAGRAATHTEYVCVWLRPMQEASLQAGAPPPRGGAGCKAASIESAHPHLLDIWTLFHHGAAWYRCPTPKKYPF